MLAYKSADAPRFSEYFSVAPIQYELVCWLRFIAMIPPFFHAPFFAVSASIFLLASASSAIFLLGWANNIVADAIDSISIAAFFIGRLVLLKKNVGGCSSQSNG